MKWEASYLGGIIARVSASNEAYEILDRHGLESWQAGGCAVLASALGRRLGHTYALVREDTGHIDHFVTEYAGAFIDADGAFTRKGMVAKYEYLEGVDVNSLRPTPVTASAHISCPFEAVAELGELLEEHIPAELYE